MCTDIYVCKHKCRIMSMLKLLQPCPTLCSPLDYSPPGSSVHGIFQARSLEWVAISCSRRSACISCIGRQILYEWTIGEIQKMYNVIYMCNIHIFNCYLKNCLMSNICWINNDYQLLSLPLGRLLPTSCNIIGCFPPFMMRRHSNWYIVSPK